MFQSIIIKNHLSHQDTDKIANAFADFSAHFQNPSIQENIQSSKEEQYQEGFLKDLFVRVFGYTLNPQPDYNLTTELKNLKGSKKCDGAILKNGKATAVIELKGMDTTDLSRIEAQAFGYKNNHPSCRYVITSNFQKLRFYIDNAIEFLEFDLFRLTEEDFAIMYLLLHKDNLLNDLPAQLKNESISQEEKITHALYKDYSAFKRDLFDDICKNNPHTDTLTLFTKTQKLLDRLLFIFFAEDSGLLPANTAHTMIKEWKELQKLKMHIGIYDQLKRYFGFLNTGYNDNSTQIFAYNGGLFKPDEILDTIIISDDLLKKHIIKLADYDYSSEIDVNILGHIFENSLNEIDEIKAKINGDDIDKTQTKRKKDGVFYTPKYITNYIVQNTIGKLCADQKVNIGIVESDYASDKKRQKKTQETLLNKLRTYRKWLLGITICDPACGSGAFLNEALNFLMAEHRYLDELESKLFGGGLVFQEVRNHILENNLFGVDINTESVEIAKLSLWLRTAEPHRKLSNLNSNIKCGNSLIDDKNIAGEKAFDWQKEFPQVFANGGFDVVIGNPPYGVNFDEKTKNYLTSFDNLVPDYEIYIYFISLYKKILKENGILSYIFPNTFLSTIFGKKYREFLFNQISVTEIVDLSNDNTFNDASVRTIILTFKNKKDDYISNFSKIRNKEIYLLEKYNKEDILQNLKNIFSLFSQTKTDKIIINKIQKHKSLNNYFEVSQGLIPYDKYRGHDEFTIKNRIWHSEFQKDETYKRELKGGDVNAYNIKWNGKLWISYGDWLAAPRLPKFFNENRILVREITGEKLFCCYTEEEFYNTPSIINIIDEKNILKLKYALSVLNSKLIGWYHNKVSPKANKGLFPKILVNDVRNLPIPKINENEQQPFIAKAEQMLALNKALGDCTAKFLRMLERKFNIDKPSKALTSWHELDFKGFIKELAKKKIKLSLTEEAEWEDYFLAEQQKAMALRNEIDQTDQTINQMVYDLYGLSPEERLIVDNS